VKISVLIHTDLWSLLSDYLRSLADNHVFSRLGFVQVSALLFLFQGCKDMRREEFDITPASEGSVPAAGEHIY